ncbi:MAG: DciA family protein [Planctomycetota bacterium]|nr:DciA family protein [Planctomycetota bacterium]MDA1139737.1 DciA family protein [Planctomycetota bacterium]
MFSQFKDLIGDVSKQLGLDQRARVQAYADSYAQIVEERVLKLTRLTTIREGVLEIEVTLAPMLMELSQYQKRTILKGLKQLHPEIRDIHFRAARKTTG